MRHRQRIGAKAMPHIIFAIASVVFAIMLLFSVYGIFTTEQTSIEWWIVLTLFGLSLFGLIISLIFALK